MNPPIFSIARYSVTLLAIVMIQSCATAAPIKKNVQTTPKSSLSVENILLWPLEGPTGVDKLIDSLLTTGVLEKYRGPQYFSREELVLADGFVISSSWIVPGARKLDINLKEHPCLLPRQAKMISSAIKEPHFFSSHGEQLGETYSVEVQRVLVSFTTDVSYKCVRSINIFKLSDGVKKNDNIRRE